MPRFRTALALLSLTTLAGCATTSASTGQGTPPTPSEAQPAASAVGSDAGKAQPPAPNPTPPKKPVAAVTRPARKEPASKPAPEAPAPASSVSDAQAEFVCRQDGALERRAPSERPAGVVAFSDGMTRPEKLSGPRPTYTQEALAQNVQGQMLARCILSREGTVRSCRILKPLPSMNEEVLLSLCASRYAPALEQGLPVDVEYTFIVRLDLP